MQINNTTNYHNKNDVNLKRRRELTKMTINKLTFAITNICICQTIRVALASAHQHTYSRGVKAKKKKHATSPCGV